MSFTVRYLQEAAQILQQLDPAPIDRLVQLLTDLRQRGGRLFFLGGDLERNISPNLVRAVQYAKEVGATVLGITGRNGGYTGQVADACVIVPTVNAVNVTPHAEAFQAVVWHLLVSHPALNIGQTT